MKPVLAPLARHVRRLVWLALGAMPAAMAQQHAHEHAGHSAPAGNTAVPDDARQAVAFPASLRAHTLANMRDHLVALAEIQAFLGGHDFDGAAAVAEQRLGMSSLDDHGAHEVAKYMPQGMQAAGSAMHRSASRFALAAQEAAVTHDLAPALAALSEVTQACNACHAGYRLE